MFLISARDFESLKDEIVSSHRYSLAKSVIPECVDLWWCRFVVMSVMIWELQLRVPRSAFGFEIEFFLLFLSLPGWLRFFLASIPSMALLGDKRSDRAQNHVCHRENKVHDRVFYRNDNLDELKLALFSFICCGVHWKSQQPTGYGFQEFLQKCSKEKWLLYPGDKYW